MVEDVEPAEEEDDEDVVEDIELFRRWPAVVTAADAEMDCKAVREGRVDLNQSRSISRENWMYSFVMTWMISTPTVRTNAAAVRNVGYANERNEMVRKAASRSKTAGWEIIAIKAACCC